MFNVIAMPDENYFKTQKQALQQKHFGNIIVSSIYDIDHICTGFYVSIDQGVTWNSTKFSVP